MRNTVNLKLNLLDDPDVFDYMYVNQNNEILDKEFGNLFNNKSEYVLTTGNANTYLATLAGITGYYEGLCLKIKIHADSNNNCTLNVNNLGAKYIKDSYGNIVTNLKKDIPYHICYNGSDFILLGKGGGGNATSDKILESYTATVDGGPIVGTMKNNGTKIFTPGRNNIAISEGYHNGQGYIKGDPNLIPENILDTAEIWGIKGTAKKLHEASESARVKTTITLDFTPKIIFIYVNSRIGAVYSPIGSLATETGDSSYLTLNVSGNTFSVSDYSGKVTSFIYYAIGERL